MSHGSQRIAAAPGEKPLMSVRRRDHGFAVSPLRRGKASWADAFGAPVCRNDHAGGRRHAVDESELGECSIVSEHSESGAEDEGVDEERVLVDEVAPRERANELSAAEDDEVTIIFLLQVG